ncbi:transposase family protein [Thiorhodovibrio frisius]|uniref:Transposase family protein n=2 Tax=Thiorhodovibrio frisius TaxID=631362 RepID=H8YYE1_9GAMM|nr:transposase family protein [Thiorhodovibrio frisius]
MYTGINGSLSSADFVAEHRLKAGAFTRQRDLPFERLVAFLMKPRARSTETELASFFAAIEGEAVASEVPTRSAVSKARKGLAASVFEALNRQAVAGFFSGFGRPTWHGFRLRAVDGTTFRLPDGEDIERFFGAQSSGPVLARGSLLYDLDLEMVLDFAVAAYCVSELELAVDHLKATAPGDLVIYDRGYPALWLFALHRTLGVDCVMRLARKQFKEAEPFWHSDAPSALITLHPSAQQARACRDQGAETRSVLEETRLPARLFKDLYHRRWGVEEGGYKVTKVRAEMENLSGRTSLAVRQDMHAKVLAMNLAAMLRAVAQLVAKRLYETRRFDYKVRMTSALSHLSDQLFDLLYASPSGCAELITRIIQRLSQTTEQVRPGRSFPRHTPGQRKAGYHIPYKRVV